MPSLALGTYQYVQCTPALVRAEIDLTPYDADVGSGEVTLEIVGNDGQVAWGRVTAKLCRLVSSTVVAGEIVRTYACHFLSEGRFAARIESAQSNAPINPPPECSPVDGGQSASDGGAPPPPPDGGAPPPPPDAGAPPAPPDGGAPPPPDGGTP